MLAGLALVAGGVAWALHAPPHPRRPEPTGVYQTGGEPSRDPAIEAALALDLPQLVRETDDDVRGRPAPARLVHADKLRAVDAFWAHGPELTRAWADLIDALGRWDDVPSKRRVAELRVAAREVSDQLAALGIGYRVEVTAFDRHAFVLSYRVEGVRFERAGASRVRVLDLRRIDPLDVAPPLLGLQTDDGDDPVVMLDAIEDTADTKLAGSAFAIGDDAWAGTPDGQRIAAVAGAAIARELAAARTDAAVALAATVRRHEARHAIDLATREPGDPPALARYLPKTAGLVRRSCGELSAYLSQIASDPVTPQLGLWNLANLGFDAHLRGTAETFVAAVVIEGLARHEGIRGSEAPAIRNGVVDREHLEALALPLAALSDDELRRAARELWLDFYHTPLEPIVDDP